MCRTVQNQSSFVSLLAKTSFVMIDLIFRYHLLLSFPFLSLMPRSLFMHLITMDLPFFPTSGASAASTFSLPGPGTASFRGYAPRAPMQNRRRDKAHDGERGGR